MQGTNKGLVDFGKLSPEEFEALRSKVMPFVPKALEMIGAVTVFLLKTGISLEQIEKGQRNAVQASSAVGPMGQREDRPTSFADPLPFE